MASYVGVAKRIASSFFPRVVPVPQLQPLDARNIFYASEEDAWAAFLTWEEEKAQEREEKTMRAARAATRMKYDIYDPSTWPPYLWPAQPAPAAPDANEDDEDDEDAPKKGVAALKGKLGNLNVMIPGAAPPSRRPKAAAHLTPEAEKKAAKKAKKKVRQAARKAAREKDEDVGDDDFDEKEWAARVERLVAMPCPSYR